MTIIKETLTKFITRLEENQIGPIQVILWLVLIGIVKYLFEDIIFFRKWEATDYLNDGIYIILFYTMVYLSTMTIIKALSQEEMKRIVNISVFFFPILLIGPIIDYFIHKIPEPYYLVSWNTTLIDCIKRYPGITLTGLYMMFLAGIYISLKKNIWRGIIGFILIYLVYYYIFASQLLRDIRTYIVSFGILDSLPLDFQRYPYTYVYNSIYLLVALICSLIFLHFYDSLLFKKLLRRIRLERALQYLLILTFGFSVVGDFHPIRLFIHFMNLLGVLCMWIGSVLINDYYDLENDRINRVKRNVEYIMNKTEAYTLAIILWLFALLIALQISSIVFFMYLIVITICYLYSAPPARFKRHIFSSVFIGFNTFMLVFIGVFATINATIYNDRVFYIAILFGVTMAAGANVIDLKDYQGDLETGIKSLPTVLGLERAKYIIAGLTGISYLTLGYFLAGIMRTPWYYAAILPAIAMPWLILKYQNSKLWWSIYLGFHILTLANGILINIFFAYFHLVFSF
jgi:4-hydroxybenzoate polyprenyltransferase